MKVLTDGTADKFDIRDITSYSHHSDVKYANYRL